MKRMKLILKAQQQKMLKNNTQRHKDQPSPFPVVKLFYPCGASTWLLTEIDSEDNDRMFGLCDHGHGFPELGWVSLSEIQSFRGRFGIGIERDRWFRANKPLHDYADEARANQRIMA